MEMVRPAVRLRATACRRPAGHEFWAKGRSGLRDKGAVGCVVSWATPAANRAPKHGWQMAADLVHDGNASVGSTLGFRRSKLGEGCGWIWHVRAALSSASDEAGLKAVDDGSLFPKSGFLVRICVRINCIFLVFAFKLFFWLSGCFMLFLGNFPYMGLLLGRVNLRGIFPFQDPTWLRSHMRVLYALKMIDGNVCPDQCLSFIDNDCRIGAISGLRISLDRNEGFSDACNRIFTL